MLFVVRLVEVFGECTPHHTTLDIPLNRRGNKQLSIVKCLRYQHDAKYSMTAKNIILGIVLGLRKIKKVFAMLLKRNLCNFDDFLPASA